MENRTVWVVKATPKEQWKDDGVDYGVNYSDKKPVSHVFNKPHYEKIEFVEMTLKEAWKVGAVCGTGKYKGINLHDLIKEQEAKE